MWSTINKNVDWINYIYYNPQRFVNYSRDALKGIAEQLDATSRLAWGNWLALGITLAEKGGVYVIMGFPGDACGKEPTANAGNVRDVGMIPGLWKIPWRRALQPTPVFLPGESYGQKSLVVAVHRVAKSVRHNWSALACKIKSVFQTEK